MEVKFGPSSGAAPIDVESKTVPTPVAGVTVETQTTVAPAPSVGVPAVTGALLGDFLPQFEDLNLPRLNIVQGVGKLKDQFPQGALVFNQSLVLFTLPIIDGATGNTKQLALPPVGLTVLGFFEKRFVEKVAGGARGAMVKSEEAVRAAGGTLDYNEWKRKESSGMKRFERLATAMILVERPAHIADDDTVFVYEADGKKYALGLWAMKGSGYTRGAKTFFTHRMTGCLQKRGYPSYCYSVSTRVDSFSGNTYYVPVCIPSRPNTPEVIRLASDIIGSPSAVKSVATAEGSE